MEIVITGSDWVNGKKSKFYRNNLSVSAREILANDNKLKLYVNSTLGQYHVFIQDIEAETILDDIAKYKNMRMIIFVDDEEDEKLYNLLSPTPTEKTTIFTIRKMNEFFDFAQLIQKFYSRPQIIFSVLTDKNIVNLTAKARISKSLEITPADYLGQWMNDKGYVHNPESLYMIVELVIKEGNKIYLTDIKQMQLIMNSINGSLCFNEENIIRQKSFPIKINVEPFSIISDEKLRYIDTVFLDNKNEKGFALLNI